MSSSSSSSCSHKISTNDEYENSSRGFDSIVSKTKEAGAFTSISDALNAIPTNKKGKYYIHVKTGIYNERVVVPKNLTNVVLIGDGTSTTKVQWNRHCPKFGTDQTGTISIYGDGFIARNLSLENTTKYVDDCQACAAVVQANHVAFYKCTFYGYQDTLYAKSGIQFYRECDIYGTVDFICGGAAAVFQNCNMYANVPREIAFTAQYRDPPAPAPAPAPAPPSGFVIQNCKLTFAPELKSHMSQFTAFLGRPWSIYSTVVVMESYLDSIIQPVGWTRWSTNRPDNKVFYREFKNSGPGSNRDDTGKKYWHVFDHPEQIKSFTVGEFINKDGWLAGTHIPYYNGFTSDHHHHSS